MAGFFSSLFRRKKKQEQQPEEEQKLQETTAEPAADTADQQEQGAPAAAEIKSDTETEIKPEAETVTEPQQEVETPAAAETRTAGTDTDVTAETAGKKPAEQAAAESAISETQAAKAPEEAQTVETKAAEAQAAEIKVAEEAPAAETKTADARAEAPAAAVGEVGETAAVPAAEVQPAATEPVAEEPAAEIAPAGEGEKTAAAAEPQPVPKKRKPRKKKQKNKAQAGAETAAAAKAEVEVPKPEGTAEQASIPSESAADIPPAEEKTAAEPEAKPEAAEVKAEAAEVKAEPAEAKEEPAAAAENKEAAGEGEAEQKKEVRESFFARLKKTRENLAFGLSALLKGRNIDEDLYEELETSLLTADLGVETTDYVISKLREEAKLRELHDASMLRKRLRQILISLLEPCEQPLQITEHKPFVILMVGVNGAGKTTTIGKLARKYKDQGLKVMLAAGDTFRAAAVEQLKEWGARADVPVISQPTGSDSASVIFDALNAAKSRGMDVLICDTAGRLQNKSQLMEELKKIVRVMRRIDAAVPHEVLLVLDAATGQNAVSQTRIFKEAVEVSGICLTKLDGTAKGGVIFALADKFKLPLRFVGLGEKAEDLRPFDAEAFVDALLKED